MAGIAYVVDLGSQNIKAGYTLNFPTDVEPRVVTPCSATATPLPQASGTAAPDIIGGNILSQIIHPIQGGRISDWEVLESLLSYVLYDQLGWIQGEEGNLLMSEPIMTSRDERELLAQLAFETFNVSGYFASDQAVLSLYSIGKVNGIVLDMGLDKIDVSPVVEGLLHQSAAVRLPYGGRHLTQLLEQLLVERGIRLSSTDAAEALKIACMRVAPLPSEDARAVAAESATHTLPDGQTITVTTEGQRLGEALLDPSILGMELPSLAHIVHTAGMVTTLHGEREARKALMENIMLCGGGSCAPGTADRLLTEVKELALPSLLPSLCTCPEYMPSHTLKNASWMGGAVLAKLVFGNATVHHTQQPVTKADYDEMGPGAVHRKCS